MARLLLLVAHLAEIGDDYAAQLAARERRRRRLKKTPGPRAVTRGTELTRQPDVSGRPELKTILAGRARRGIPT
jgi:hypothetical protein